MVATNTVEIVIKGTDLASGAISDVDRNLGGLRDKLHDVGGSMVAVGGKMTAGLTLPLAALGVKAVTTAGDFEAAMNVLTIAARESGTSMDDLSKAAINVGKDTDLVGIDAMEAADAMTTFYKAGLDTTDIFADLQGYLSGTTPLMGAMRAAVDLAAASNIDLAQASDAVAIAMATFGLSADDASRIADSFVGAADASVAEVSDLTDALANVGPTMASFGYSLEDTNTALALLSTRGITGAEAGTALKSMMTNLMRPTAEVTGTLKDLNVSLYDQEGRLKPLPQIIGDLEKAMAGMTDEQRNQTIQTLAGTYGMKTMNTLLAEGKGGWDEMAEKIDAAASAQEVGAARTQGFNAAMEQLQGAIQTFMITVGTPLIENVLTPLVQKLQGVFERLIELDPKLLNIGLVIAGVAAAAGPLLMILGTMAMAFSALMSPIGLVIGAVALLGVAFATNFLGIRDAVTGFIEAVSPIIQTIIEWFKVNIPIALEFLKGLWDEYWPAIQTVLETVWNAIETVISTVINAVVPFIMDQFGGIVAWVQENWPLIQQTIETVLNAIRTVVETVVGFIANFWESNHTWIEAVATTVWNSIKTVIDTIIHTILDIIRAVMQMINGDWEGAWETIKGIGERIWDAIKTIWNDTMEAIKTVLEEILPKIQEFWDNIWTSIKDKVVEIWGAIWTKISSAIADIDGKIKRAFGNIKSFFADTWDNIADIFTTAFRNLVTKADEFGRNIMTALKNAMGSIKLPIPTFSVGWSEGPLGVKIPHISVGVDWRALRDVVPWLAEGGIITRPTLAVLGERGPEAVVPLGNRGGGTGLSLDGRAITLLTEIRNILAETTGTSTGRYAYSDMMWDLEGARA